MAGMSEQRRSSSPRAKAGRNAARGNAQQQAAERKAAEQRRNRSIALGERRTTADSVRAAEPAPTAAGGGWGGGLASAAAVGRVAGGERCWVVCVVGGGHAGDGEVAAA